MIVLALHADLSALQTAVLALMGFDLCGGAVVNAARTAGRRFHCLEQSARRSLIFCAAHIHTLVPAAVFPLFSMTIAIQFYIDLYWVGRLLRGSPVRAAASALSDRLRHRHCAPDDMGYSAATRRSCAASIHRLGASRDDDQASPSAPGAARRRSSPARMPPVRRDREPRQGTACTSYPHTLSALIQRGYAPAMSMPSA